MIMKVIHRQLLQLKVGITILFKAIKQYLGPWTVNSYIIEGGSSKTFSKVLNFCPSDLKEIIERYNGSNNYLSD